MNHINDVIAIYLETLQTKTGLDHSRCLDQVTHGNEIKMLIGMF